MFTTDFTKNLKPHEEVIKLVKPRLIIYFWQLLLATFFIVMAFFLMYPLFQLDILGLAIFIVLIIISLVLYLRSYACYKNTALLITDTRIVDFHQKGLFFKEVSEIIFENIEDISYNKKGIAASLFNYGTLEIQTAAQKFNIEVKGLPSPDKIQSLITDIKTDQE